MNASPAKGLKYQQLDPPQGTCRRLAFTFIIHLSGYYNQIEKFTPRSFLPEQTLESLSARFLPLQPALQDKRPPPLSQRAAQPFRPNWLLRRPSAHRADCYMRPIRCNSYSDLDTLGLIFGQIPPENWLARSGVKPAKLHRFQPGASVLNLKSNKLTHLSSDGLVHTNNFSPGDH